jgi:peroxiredoxin Q/BCP
MPEPSDPAPDFALPTTDGFVRLSDLTKRGKVVLAFYAEDNTPACSNEVQMLAADYDVVRELGATVIAVSSDSVESHKGFAERIGGAPFPLASDATLAVARSYGVADKETKRCRRAVFVIDETGTVVHAEPWFQPGNVAQYEAIFRALGLDA